MAAFKVLSQFQDVAPVLTFSIRPPGASPPPRPLEGQPHDTSTKVTGEFVRVIKQTANLSGDDVEENEGGGEGEKKRGNESAVVNVIILNANHTKAENTVDTFWS